MFRKHDDESEASYMYELTPAQQSLSEDVQDALQVAHRMINMGVPLFSAPPRTGSPGDFIYPDAWQTYRPNHVQVNRWKPGWCLAMVTGVIFDVLDIDPRNGGAESFADLAELMGWDYDGSGPTVYGTALTPSAGEHLLMGRTYLAKTTKAGKGLDLQCGDRHGEGRGFVYIAPTVRPSKYGEHKGEMVAYRWRMAPTSKPDQAAERDEGLLALVAHVQTLQAPRRPVVVQGSAAVVDDDDPFDGGVEAWTPESAERVISGQLQAVREAKAGTINGTLGGAARLLGRFVGGGFLAEDYAAGILLDALEDGGVHSDSWNVANGLKWTAASVIATGLAKGATETWTVSTSAVMPGHIVTDDGQFACSVCGSTELHKAGECRPPALISSPPVAEVYPTLMVESAAVMAYWLQQEMGRGRLSGFFARQGLVVHTPRVSELGYVPAGGQEDTNGPAEIRPVTGETLAAKLQFLYACYKTVDVKGPDGKKTGEKVDVPAMFPALAAKAAINAPEALHELRPLKGITHTPMVRADGSILATPGYDQATGFLFLPGQGVNVKGVAADPLAVDVAEARELLLTMISGFPFATDDDRANYLGMLLTPMLRMMVPPPYKMFGIGAHQPGSGKSLLAETVGIVHGMVFRSEVPDDEYGWRQMTAALLSTTSAPVVVLDNVTGILRSSALAGMLTASGEISERELGKSTNLTYTNDRVWCVTGNNLSLGGDLVRRTITVMIDPDMAHPETRTDFTIKDLPRWTAEHRNEILWALLVLIRSWTAAGRPAPARAQSDSFAAWETTVGGILAHAGIAGTFDDMSGQRAAAGGDDDETAGVLDHLWAKFGDATWTAGQAIAGDAGHMVFDSRDWLPISTLAKLGRSEAEGRKSFGYWLRNRIGRWVTGLDGCGLVLRKVGKTKDGVTWKLERRG
jgi:bifunctional DNA primase/polymerase-like protein